MFSPMLPIRIVLLVILVAICAQAQKQEAFPEGVSKKYDRFSDSTTITFRLQLDGTQVDGLMLEADYVYKGQSSAGKNMLQLSLVAISPVTKTDLFGNRDEMMILLLDGRRESFPLTVSPSDHVAGLRIKTMTASGFKDFLMPIANAKTIEGRVGVVEFKLKPTQIEMVQFFIAKYGHEFRLTPTLELSP